MQKEHFLGWSLLIKPTKSRSMHKSSKAPNWLDQLQAPRSICSFCIRQEFYFKVPATSYFSHLNLPTVCNKGKKKKHHPEQTQFSKWIWIMLRKMWVALCSAHMIWWEKVIFFSAERRLLCSPVLAHITSTVSLSMRQRWYFYFCA